MKKDEYVNKKTLAISKKSKTDLKTIGRAKMKKVLTKDLNISVFLWYENYFEKKDLWFS